MEITMDIANPTDFRIMCGRWKGRTDSEELDSEWSGPGTYVFTGYDSFRGRSTAWVYRLPGSPK